jgi:polyketide synthase PksM
VSLIVEEHEAAAANEDPPAAAAPEPQIVVLSAQDEERLRAAAQRLLAYLGEHPDVALADLAYSLQVAREAMPSRAAWVVGSRQELERGLRELIGVGDESAESAASVLAYRGELDGRTALSTLLSGAAGEAVTRTLLAERNFERLALLWVEGGEIPWRELQAARQVRRIPLPGYPFRRRPLFTAADAELAVPSAHVERSGPREADSVVPRSAAEERIVRFLVEQLDVDRAELNVKRDLREYGVDSLIGRRLLRDLEEEFSVVISGRHLLEHGTIAGLAALTEQRRRSSGRESPQGKENANSSPIRTNATLSTGGDGYGQVSLLEEYERGSIDHQSMLRLIDQGSVL